MTRRFHLAGSGMRRHRELGHTAARRSLTSLRVEGNVEICAGTGKTVNRTVEAALCPCRQSANKPYCDR